MIMTLFLPRTATTRSLPALALAEMGTPPPGRSGRWRPGRWPDRAPNAEDLPMFDGAM